MENIKKLLIKRVITKLELEDQGDILDILGIDLWEIYEQKIKELDEEQLIDILSDH